MRTDLLLVLSLQVQSGLDVASRLLKGLSLRDLCWVVGADPNDVGAQEDQHVCTQLRGEKEKKDSFNVSLVISRTFQPNQL